LIDVHLGHTPIDTDPRATLCVAVTRWVIAPSVGVLKALTLPSWSDPGIRSVEVYAQAGDHVHPPFENADRLACVMTTGTTQNEAQTLAERFVADTRITYQPEALLSA
jgi:hypothetical protein